MNRAKEKAAIERLRAFEPEESPYHLCYSGGKDSDTIRILAQLAGVRHDIVNNHTTVDAPETVRYIRQIPNIRIDYPQMSMWQLIEKKMVPPTRLMRYCCKELKERGGAGRVKITGVRWAESFARKQNSDLVKIIGKPKTVQKMAIEEGAQYRVTSQQGLVLNHDNDASRRMVEQCYRTTSTMVNPIVDWTDDDVWDFLHYYKCDSNPLYACGFKRIGCIGCPMGGPKSMKREFARYPKYKQLYVRAFDRMVEARKKNNRTQEGVWIDGERVYRWWVGEDAMQIRFDDLDGTEEMT